MTTPAPDYTEMKDWEMLAACGADATKWAAAYCQHAKKFDYEIDEGLMTTWFANAIMHSLDVMTGTGPTVLPDGSAFFVGEVGS
jgi:hypothetical protein